MFKLFSLFKFLFLTDTPATDTPTETTEAAAESTDKMTPMEKIFNFNWGLPSQVQTLVNKLIEILVVIVIFIILCKIINLISRGIRKRLEKKHADKTISSVVYQLVNKGAKIILFFMMIGTLGVDTSSIIGLFTATGLGIGLALQGALSNFAGGILIIIIRPFKLDDYIECQGVSGTVEEIHIFYTHLRTPDNKLIYVPNGALIGGNVINYSAKETRRLDLNFSIDYTENFVNAEKIIKEVALAHSFVLKDPEIFVRVTEFGDSAIILTLRCWVKGDDYWNVRFDLLEQVYMALKTNGVKIPYRQLEISYRKALEEQKKENK